MGPQVAVDGRWALSGVIWIRSTAWAISWIGPVLQVLTLSCMESFAYSWTHIKQTTLPKSLKMGNTPSKDNNSQKKHQRKPAGRFRFWCLLSSQVAFELRKQILSMLSFVLYATVWWWVHIEFMSYPNLLTTIITLHRHACFVFVTSFKLNLSSGFGFFYLDPGI